MSAKKKTPQQLKAESNKRYAANKKAKAEAARIEAALTPDPIVAPKAEMAPEVASLDTFNSDSFNEYAPNLGLPAMVQIAAPEEPLSFAPEMVTAPSACTPSHTVPESLPESLEDNSEAIVVERLINAINYLYPIAKRVNGLHAPKLEALEKISKNIKLARLLIQKLK